MAFWKFLLVFGLCWCAAADAQRPLTVERLVAESSLVIHGEVARKTTRRDEKGRIVTEVIVSIRARWKGDWDAPQLTLLHGGGVLGEIGARVVGQASYTPGEEVVLFLTPNGQGQFVTVGMSWGKFAVQTNAEGDRAATQSGTETAPIPFTTLRQQVQQPIANE